MASGKLEQVLNTMKVGGTEEYLKSSLTVLKIMQNIMVHPDTEKFKKIRLAATVLSKPGMVELLKVVGFQEQGNYLVFPSNGSIEQLKSWKKQILECRKQTGYIEGWDVPGTSLKFSDLLGSGKFGDVFKGFLDNQSVAIKTLKPDCGDLAKQEFDRETRIMSKLHHNNVLKMLALVLTSDPVSLVLELMKDNMLVVLHNQKELGEEEILRYISQVSEGMEYVHQQSILHCDLAARNILLDHSDNVKISDFGLSRTAGTEECNLVGKERQLQFPIRWTAPEVFSKLYVDRKTDVWSFGILFYEFVTAGSVPYAALSNAEVRKQVQEGHRLTQPEECPAPFFHLMQQCWSNDPDKRPTFADINKELQRIRYNNTNPAEHRLSVSDVKERDRASSVASPKKQKKLIKIKESSYHQALDKGGGLIRVYTALVPPFRHRTVIACLPKTTVKEAIQMVLVQLGRDYVDPKDYHIAMLCDIIDQPPRFLSSNEQIYPMKNCKRQFILCTHQAVGNESMILEALVASAQTNPAMIKALDPCTRGYLVSQFEVPKNIQQEVDWSRSWVAIDGSTIFMYRDEEDEGVKECQHYIDLRGCTCDLASIKGKPKGTIIRIQKPEGPSYLLQASDKPEVLRWIDAIQIASTQEPSPRLADVVEGAVVQEGYLEYQEYLLDMVQRADLSKFRMTIQRNLQSSLQQQSSLTSNTKVDHGRQWSQLKSNGKLQVFYTGKPETLFELSSATLVKLNHPPALTRSADYSIEVTTAISRVVLKADLPSEHHEWSEAIQHVLREQKRDGIIQIGGDTGTPSGYVRLKRLMSKKKLQQQHSFGKLPANSASSISEETHAVTPSQDEVAEGLYEDAKFIERVKSLMPDLKPPEPYLIQSPAPPPLPPRISPSTSLSNGVVANGGVALRPSHQSLSVQPVGKMTPRSTSAYNLHWARPLTHSDDFNLPGQFQRMDQQYLSFNAQRRRLVSPASSQQQYNNDLHYPSSSVAAVPSRLDYHAAFDISRDNHLMYQNHMGKQPKHHIGQYQHHINQHQYDVNQQHNIISSPPGQMSPKHDPANKQNQQYRVGQLLDHVSQQPYHVSQQPNHVSQQLDHVSQQPYHVSQQPNHVSQQPYRVNQQDHVSQQPYHVSQEPNHVIQQQYHVSHQQQKLNQYQYPVNQQDLMSQQQNFATQQQYLASQQDLVRQKNYNQPQNFLNQHEDHVSHQRHHVTQQDHVNQPQHNQQHQVSQHQYQTNQNPMNQQQDHVNKQWYHVTQQHDHMSHQYHNQRQYQDQEDHVRALPYHVTQQDHVSQQQSHTTQQKNNVSQRPSHIVASQQQDHMIQQQDHMIQQQDHTIQQQDHTIQQQDHTSQNHVIQQKHQNQMMRRTSSPNQQYSPQAPPEGYVRMHSVPPPLLNTTPEYVEMNSQFNEAPHSYSLNVPNTPDSEASQKPLELLSKQEPPRVAPKPSRPPKKSALLTTGGGRAVDAEDMSPPHGASPPRSEAATPTNAPPIPVKKKNSLHRRKGPVIYDQPPTGGIRQITQQLESTSLSQPRPTQVQTSSQNDIHHNRTVDTSPPVAPITTPPNQENTKSLPPGWFAEMDTARGQLYYFNRDMGYTTWNYDEIMNIHHDNQTKSPGAGWKAVKTPDGRTYFYHATTRQTTWTIADTWT